MIRSKSDGSRPAAEVEKTTSQFNDDKAFGERWNNALQSSVTTRSDRKKADDAALKADPSLEQKSGWREAYDSHEKRPAFCKVVVA